MVYKNCVNDLYTTVQIFDLNLLELAFLDHRLEKKFAFHPRRQYGSSVLIGSVMSIDVAILCF